MNGVVDLNDYKNKKKYLKTLSDIEKILQIIKLAMDGLNYFNVYGPVKEMLAMLDGNKAVMEIHKKNYVEKLQAVEKKYTI
jgi:hypothetical protein